MVISNALVHSQGIAKALSLSAPDTINTHLGVHSIRHSKNTLPQHCLGTTKPPCDFWEVPNWLNGHLSHDGFSTGHQNFAIGYEPSGGNCLTCFWEVDVGLGDGDGWADVKALVEVTSVGLVREL